MGYTITIGNLNIFYLKDIHDFFYKNYISKTGVVGKFLNHVPVLDIWNNVIHYPTYYSANVLPEEVKDKILHRVTRPQEYGMKLWDTDLYNNDIVPVLNHANKGCKNKDWLSFVKETIETDRYRKESFEKLFPNCLK